MANIKISEFQELTDVTGNEYIPVVDSNGDNKKVKMSNQLAAKDKNGNDIVDTYVSNDNLDVKLSFISSQLETPIPIAAWTAKGKKNNDADKSVLKDITGNGHDINLFGFDFNENGSGYENEGYEDALIFDGIDDYGMCNNLPFIPNGYTFIIKRKRLTEMSENAIFLKGTNPNNSILTFENKAANGIIYEVSYGFDNNGRVRNFSKNEIVYRTDTSYEGVTLSRGSYVENETNKTAFLGSLNGYRFSNFAFYSAYLFDKTLTEEEIKSFVRKNIDPEYLLPINNNQVLEDIDNGIYKANGIYSAKISSINIDGVNTPLSGNSTIITIGDSYKSGHIEQIVIASINSKPQMLYRSWDLTLEAPDFTNLFTDTTT